MGKYFAVIFSAAIILSQCSAGYAGWFDRKKEPVSKTVEQKTAQVTASAKNAVDSALSQPETKSAVAPQAQPAYMDVTPKGAKWDYEAKSDAKNIEANTVRLDSGETQKIKDEMMKVRQEIQSAQSAADFKPMAVPSIPKTPTVVRAPKPVSVVIPTKPVKPESFKKMKPVKVSGYKS